jgi:hypothetical protein
VKAIHLDVVHGVHRGPLNGVSNPSAHTFW